MKVFVQRRLTPARLILDPQDRVRLARTRRPPPDAPPPVREDYFRRWALRAPEPRPRPPGRLTLELTHRLPADLPAQPLPRRLRLVVVANSQGYLTFFDRVRETSGGPYLSGLPEGRYQLEVTSPYMQPAYLPVTLAGEAGADVATVLLIDPGPAYPFDVIASEPPARVEGRVTTAEGSVPPAALLRSIRLELRADGRLLGPPVAPDGGGRFLLIVDPPRSGPFRLLVIDPEGDAHELATAKLPLQSELLGLSPSPLPFN